MLEYGTFSAWISIDGAPTPEYDMNSDLGNKTVTCWIPSQANRSFTIHWKVEYNLVTTAGYITIDGQHCGGVILPAFDPADPHSPFGGTLSKDCVTLPSEPFCAERQFTFSDVVFTDDDRYEWISTRGLGEITVRIDEVELLGLTPRSGINFHPALLIHEKSKKILGHLTSLGPERFNPLRSPLEIMTRSKQTFVNFVFRYRPLEMLHAYGIVPDPDLLALTYQALVYKELTIAKEEYEQEADSTIIKTPDPPDPPFSPELQQRDNAAVHAATVS